MDGIIDRTDVWKKTLLDDSGAYGSWSNPPLEM
jgi:hypothetical protein